MFIQILLWMVCKFYGFIYEIYDVRCENGPRRGRPLKLSQPKQSFKIKGRQPFTFKHLNSASTRQELPTTSTIPWLFISDLMPWLSTLVLRKNICHTGVSKQYNKIKIKNVCHSENFLETDSGYLIPLTVTILMIVIITFTGSVERFYGESL